MTVSAWGHTMNKIANVFCHFLSFIYIYFYFFLHLCRQPLLVRLRLENRFRMLHLANFCSTYIRITCVYYTAVSFRIRSFPCRKVLNNIVTLRGRYAICSLYICIRCDFIQHADVFYTLMQKTTVATRDVSSMS